MRKSFKLLLTLALCLITLGMKAATVTGALYNKEFTIEYQSVDAQNKPVTLTAKLYYLYNMVGYILNPKPSEIKSVVLNCHPTITHEKGCPTGEDPQMGAIKYMISENALVICPDYIGFGKTTNKVHPYMCATLTARNVMDCYKAAIDHALNTIKATINKNYYTINVGYSQGGATALAFQKYLETEATQAERDLVKLRGSICGAGPYNQNLLFEEYEKQTELDYPVYMYYILRGHKEAFGQTTMRNLDLKECFTTDFWSYCEKTLRKTLDDKDKNVDEINQAIKDAGFKTFASIMNKEYFDHTSRVYRTIYKTLEQSNLLKDDDWTPKAEVTLFHSMKDIVVPPSQSIKAKTFLESKGCAVRLINAIDDYSVSENELWQDAVFGEGILGGISGALGNTTYDFNSHDHRNCGARFYAMFLAGNLRPTTTTPVNRAAETVAIATPINQEVAKDASSVAGYFDVITTAMPYDIPKGEGVFVQFPAKVDGYYFDCTERYKVTLNVKGEAIAYTEMEDTDDYEANEVYYIVSKKKETMPIISMTAGIKTPTVESNLAWRELNIRKLNILNGKGYATAYMPFAYSSSIAYTGEDAGDYIIGKPAESIATGTGAILVNEGTAETTILEALIDTPNGGETTSCLSGTYTSIDNNGYLTFGRNKADMNEVGFFAYTGSTIKPYSCYYTGSAPAKVLVLNGEETAINSINNNETTEIFTINGTRTSQLQKGINLVRRGGETVKLYIK